uniref:GRAM domain containing 4 n=1 Tax=Gadus morhua TaxID=8049 RepID=A0A8C5CVF9_GADMO
MLKRLDKIRFRGPRSRDELLDLAESPPASDNEGGDDLPIKPRPLPREMDDQLRDPAGTGSPTMAAALQDFQRAESDRLNEVKGHLEIALLEKHFLQEELRKLREETNVDLLRQELEKERGKRIDLEQRMSEVLRTRLEDSPPQPPRKQQSPTNTRTDKPQREEWSSRFQRWWYDRFGVYMEDFRFQPEETTVEAEEPLSAKRLTENMRRLKRGARPVTNFMRNLSALSNWHSVYTSGIAFIIYMNAAWHGWAMPMFLFLAILRLSLNYLIARGWRIQWSIVPEVSESVDPPKEDLTVSEKFQLVLDVAQKAQNLFGKMSDVLEKIKNLFMWVQPESTQKLYVGLWVAFITSCLLPYKLMGFMMGEMTHAHTHTHTRTYTRTHAHTRTPLLLLVYLLHSVIHYQQTLSLERKTDHSHTVSHTVSHSHHLLLPPSPSLSPSLSPPPPQACTLVLSSSSLTSSSRAVPSCGTNTTRPASSGTACPPTPSSRRGPTPPCLDGYAHTQTGKHTHTHKPTQGQTHTPMKEHIHTHAHTRIYTHTHTYSRAHTHIMYTYTHTCAHTHARTHTSIYTHR